MKAYLIAKKHSRVYEYWMNSLTCLPGRFVAGTYFFLAMCYVIQLHPMQVPAYGRLEGLATLKITYERYSNKTSWDLDVINNRQSYYLLLDRWP